ncbi:MAG: glycogen synthase [Cyanobacteria bacterium SIG32]|nr:glycogen synthase [Cyanobacteria bacterium SIG32]
MNKKILIISSECAPYQKLGGLGDANADFTKAYKNNFPNDDISIILPLYDIEAPNDEIFLNGYKLEKKLEFEYKFGINISGAVLYEVINPYNQIPVKYIYSPIFSKEKEPYAGDIFKNSIAFSAAVLEYIEQINDIPDIIQTTDFPVFIKDSNNKKINDIKVVHIIHNAGPAYQNQVLPFLATMYLYDEVYLKELFKNKQFKAICNSFYKKYNKKIFYNVLDSCRFVVENYRHLEKDSSNFDGLNFLNGITLQYLHSGLEKNGMFNPIKKHLSQVDFWITDSPTYYKELQSNQMYSGELYPEIKMTENKSCAVLAGIDNERYNPKTSAAIKYNFDVVSFEEVRKLNKEYLLENFSHEKIQNQTYDKKLFASSGSNVIGGLEKNMDSILIFMSSRLDIFQKGIDIAFYALQQVLKNTNTQIIFSSPNSLKNEFVKGFVKYLESNDEYKGRFVFIDSYVPLETYCAGSDLFLMPSRFEPCGFSQLIAMRFGCIPVVCSTGGLNDTITDYSLDSKNGTGFKTQHSIFEINSPDEYLDTLIRAVEVIKNKDSKNTIIRNAMEYDSSWNSDKIRQYADVYEKILN